MGESACGHAKGETVFGGCDEILHVVTLKDGNPDSVVPGLFAVGEAMEAFGGAPGEQL